MVLNVPKSSSVKYWYVVIVFDYITSSFVVNSPEVCAMNVTVNERKHLKEDTITGRFFDQSEIAVIVSTKTTLFTLESTKY